MSERWHRIAVLVLVAFGCGREQSSARAGASTRIVAVGGSVTEVLYALDVGDRVVGVDTTSSFPEAATRLPRVGYHRTLSAEGALSLRPDLVIVTTEAGPAAALEQLRAANVSVAIVSGEPTVDAARARVRDVARMVDRQAAGESLVQALDRELLSAQKSADALSRRPRVLFVFARGETALVVAGKKTAAQHMLDIVGFENAIAEYEGYRPLTAESAIVAKPDLILVAESHDRRLDLDSVLALPGIAKTPAGEKRRVLFVDALEFLGFGPRVGRAARGLVDAVAKESAK